MDRRRVKRICMATFRKALAEDQWLRDRCKIRRNREKAARGAVQFAWAFGLNEGEGLKP